MPTPALLEVAEIDVQKWWELEREHQACGGAQRGSGVGD